MRHGIIWEWIAKTERMYCMAYEDVPQRILDGEEVPVSEVIGYAAPQTATLTRTCLSWLVLCGVLETFYTAETKVVKITPFGHAVRIDLVKRIEGDCPECPE